jgi:hypothetical protein
MAMGGLTQEKFARAMSVTLRTIARCEDPADGLGVEGLVSLYSMAKHHGLTDIAAGFRNAALRTVSDQAGEQHKQNKQIAGEFHAAYALAPLFVSDESVRLLELAKPLFYYHSDPLANFEVQDLDNTFDALERVRGQIEVSARADLGAQS